MIKIEKEKVVGFEDAIRGMRNPMNSWNRSDSIEVMDISPEKMLHMHHYEIGKNDH